MKKIALSLLTVILMVTLTGCKCAHEWKGADCITPKMCSRCAATEGEALGHDWVEASCTAAKACNRCGITSGDPLGHQWTEATCTGKKTCQRCNEEEGSPLGHQWVEATCEHPKQCSVCGETEGEALPHSVKEWLTTQKATCTEAGLAEGFCNECNTNVTMEIPMTDHTAGDWEVTKDATESEPGKHVKKCTACGSIMVEGNFTLTAEEIKAAYIAKCGTYGYQEIARNPGAYEEEYAKFSGKVIQVMQQEMLGYLTYVLRVNVNGTYSNTLYVTYSASKDDPRILDGDRITMYGQLDGEKTYETVRGDSVTIPKFIAEYIDIN